MRDPAVPTSTSIPLATLSFLARGAGGVVEANGVVLAGGDEEVLLAVEIEAAYLPGVVGEDRADGHAADDAVVQLRQRGRHLPSRRRRRRRPPAFRISCSG